MASTVVTITAYKRGKRFGRPNVDSPVCAIQLSDYSASTLPLVLRLVTFPRTSGARRQQWDRPDQTLQSLPAMHPDHPRPHVCCFLVSSPSFYLPPIVGNPLRRNNSAIPFATDAFDSVWRIRFAMKGNDLRTRWNLRR